MTITFQEMDSNWLRLYSIDQYRKYITKTSPYWERYSLISYDQYERLSIIYAIMLDDVEVGFFILPKFFEDILSSIYIDPTARKKGIAEHCINHFSIKRLSCVTENVNALSLYYRLGFKEVKTTDPFKGSLKLAR